MKAVFHMHVDSAGVEQWCTGSSLSCAILLCIVLLVSCRGAGTARPELPEWAVNATVYEVNVRQYTAEGTFRALESHLPRLKELGVEILWLMPIHPISREKRLGSLGSYYAVSDYRGINPEFGNEASFRHFMNAAHEAGFKVILDWVGNHTGWDHPWVREHPEWFTRNDSGNIASPETWTDVADLNYENKSMRKAMLEAMVYWVKEFDVDGYRCDYAGGVPSDFWETARRRLQRIKPVFMLAENDTSKALIVKAFNANYGWSFYNSLNQIAKGNKKAKTLDSWFTSLETAYPEGSWPLLFLDNHDENSWNGTILERMGDAENALWPLIFTAPGIPLVYSGNEAALDRRLAFFEKDEIFWKDAPQAELIKTLIALRQDNPALWNVADSTFEWIVTGNDNIVAFRREREDRGVFTIINVSSAARSATLKLKAAVSGTDVLNGLPSEIAAGNREIKFAPWEARIIAW